MANRTITFGAAKWVYVDNEGIKHTVTTNQLLVFNVADGGASDVKYHLVAGQKVTTTDGYTLHMSPGPSGNMNTYLGIFTDATQGTTKLSMGDWVILDPKTHKPTRWKAVSCNEDDADIPVTITATFENIEIPTQRFTWTAVDVT